MFRNVPCSGFYRRPCMEGLCAFIPSCRQSTEPKTHDSKKIRVNLERTPHQRHLNVSLEVKWIETPVRKAISALKTRKPTHRLIFNEVAKLLVFTVATFSGSTPASSSGASFFAWQRRARNEWQVMNRKGPWERYRRQVKRRLARCLLPAFLCAHIFIKRETSGYEAGSTLCHYAN